MMKDPETGELTMTFKSMGGNSADDNGGTNGQPVMGEDGVLRGDDDRLQLRFDMGDGHSAELANPKDASLKKFKEVDINEINDLVQDFRSDKGDDPNDFCDMSLLNRSDFGNQPAVIGAFINRLPELRKIKERLEKTHPLRDSGLRYRLKRELQDELNRALHDGTTEWVRRHGPLSM